MVSKAKKESSFWAMTTLRLMLRLRGHHVTVVSFPWTKQWTLLGEKLAYNSQIHLGYQGHVVTFPVKMGTIMNVVVFSSAEKWDDKEWVIHADPQKMYQDYKEWGSNVQ